MATKINFGYVLEPADRGWWWYYDQTGEQVAQLLGQNNAILTNISTYIADDNTRKFAIIMEPASTVWWYYYGQTGEQVGQLLAQHNAMLKSLCAYVDSDNVLKFAFSMIPPDRTWWWYYDQTGEQVDNLLKQNRAQLTSIRHYDHYLKNVVIMEQSNRVRTSYTLSPNDIANFLLEHRVKLIDIDAYQPNPEGVSFTTVLDPTDHYDPNAQSWGFGVTGEELGQKLRTNPHLRLSLLAPYYQQLFSV